MAPFALFAGKSEDEYSPGTVGIYLYNQANTEDSWIAHGSVAQSVNTSHPGLSGFSWRSRHEEALSWNSGTYFQANTRIRIEFTPSSKENLPLIQGATHTSHCYTKKHPWPATPHAASRLRYDVEPQVEAYCFSLVVAGNPSARVAARVMREVYPADTGVRETSEHWITTSNWPFSESRDKSLGGIRKDFDVLPWTGDGISGNAADLEVLGRAFESEPNRKYYFHTIPV